MSMYLFTSKIIIKNRASLEDKWVSEIGGSFAIFKHFEVKKEGILRGIVESVGSDQGIPGEIFWVGDMIENKAGIVEEIGIDELIKKVGLEGKCIEDDLGVGLVDLSEGFGAEKERKEHWGFDQLVGFEYLNSLGPWWEENGYRNQRETGDMFLKLWKNYHLDFKLIG